ncbi:imidazole glycerol phosphate synthase subunit HisH [Geobacter sp. OR-1]|uniref:imidazole glycerol phosphate synthase subunit HisH n=1 Tax=Geobacter sp. OR-1 TaxID=1266765 RepID=UPI0005445204|nr:imidazole glycerol phosphate synthase subunit HisH [Geobacter sp. OR-1]GAM09650.1 imidazole glycerol phosphate synthase subunit HisH [Geobacter sp. OR-1]
MSKTLIVDYGMGNLGSVRRAFEECGADVFISGNPSDISVADHIVLPGVGAFADGMTALNAAGWVDALRRSTTEMIPLLGICLGMQLLADRGFEGGETEGLGLIPGEVRRLEPDSAETRIPHVGWNEVHPRCANPLFSAIAEGTDFYFVHSYHFIPLTADDIAATTPYCGTFVSALNRGTVFGTQFHPEKSSRAGFQVIRNFLAL